MVRPPRPEGGRGHLGKELGALARLALVVTVAVVVLMHSGDLGVYVIGAAMIAWFVREATK